MLTSALHRLLSKQRPALLPAPTALAVLFLLGACSLRDEGLNPSTKSGDDESLYSSLSEALANAQLATLRSAPQRVLIGRAQLRFRDNGFGVQVPYSPDEYLIQNSLPWPPALDPQEAYLLEALGEQTAEQVYQDVYNARLHMHEPEAREYDRYEVVDCMKWEGGPKDNAAPCGSLPDLGASKLYSLSLKYYPIKKPDGTFRQRLEVTWFPRSEPNSYLVLESKETFGTVVQFTLLPDEIRASITDAALARLEQVSAISFVSPIANIDRHYGQVLANALDSPMPFNDASQLGEQWLAHSEGSFGRLVERLRGDAASISWAILPNVVSFGLGFGAQASTAHRTVGWLTRLWSGLQLTAEVAGLMLDANDLASDLLGPHLTNLVDDLSPEEQTAYRRLITVLVTLSYLSAAEWAEPSSIKRAIETGSQALSNFQVRRLMNRFNASVVKENPREVRRQLMKIIDSQTKRVKRVLSGNEDLFVCPN